MAGKPFVPTFIGDLPLARDALAYARDRHGDQRRDSDAAAFLLHPLEVAALLHNTGHGEPAVAAGILHDTLEDTDAEPGEIHERFGPEVAGIVSALTEDARIESFADRKAALREQVADFGPDAMSVYTADKVARVRELRLRASHDRGLLSRDEGRRKLEHYRESLTMLEARREDHPLVRQLRFELEALVALPPGAPSVR